MVGKTEIEKRDEEYRASLEDFARKFDELLDLNMSDRTVCCEALLRLAEETNNRSIIRLAKKFKEKALSSDWNDDTFESKFMHLINADIRQGIISAEKAIYDHIHEDVTNDSRTEPVYFDGWMIRVPNKVFYSTATGETLRLKPQLGQVFARFIKKKHSKKFKPVLTVGEIIDIANPQSEEGDSLSRAWAIKGYINTELAKTKHYYKKKPIEQASESGSGEDYAYELLSRKFLKK